jgi:acyl-CoA thioesterase-2
VSGQFAGSAALAALLDLERLEDDLFRSATDHVEGGRDRVFGGQVAAQALVAAGRTVTQGAVHSLHSYFLRPGDLAVPIVFAVDRIRNGRSFTTRRVVAVQHGEAIFNLQCSFHVDEPGPEHGLPAPAVPAPDEIADAAASSPGAGNRRAPAGLLGTVELRYVTEVPWQRNAPGTAQRVWLRAAEALPDDALLHAAAITFASDFSLLDAALQPHGLSTSTDGFTGASLDHCMWFHRPARADEWLLYDQHSPSATHARGLAIGSLYTRAGELVVTVAQEGLLRFRPGSAGDAAWRAG